MKKLIVLLLAIAGSVLTTNSSYADDTEAQAKKFCGKNKPCVSAYLRAKYYQDELKKCKAKSTSPALPSIPPPSQAPIPATSPMPNTGDSCNFTLVTKAEILVKIQSMDKDPLSAETIAALKAGCAASSVDQQKFIDGFLCDIHAYTTFSNDADIIEAVDNLEHVDTDSFGKEDQCSEINAL
ncbi:MAG: hypothetical protein HYU97_05020 [Deltaproteobacteria bacterium]|nr:hypothetical protein [Deltaproteobacteria bacterium]